MLKASDKPIVYVDDDEDDQLLFQQAVKELSISNPFRAFTDCQSALQYLETTTEEPLFILCDVNVPGMDGFELRHRLAQSGDLRRKATPFLFFSTVASPQQIQAAYASNAQGFLIKPTDYDRLSDQIQTTVAYWKMTLFPIMNQ